MSKKRALVTLPEGLEWEVGRSEYKNRPIKRSKTTPQARIDALAKCLPNRLCIGRCFNGTDSHVKGLGDTILTLNPDGALTTIVSHATVISNITKHTRPLFAGEECVDAVNMLSDAILAEYPKASQLYLCEGLHRLLTHHLSSQRTLCPCVLYEIWRCHVEIGSLSYTLDLVEQLAHIADGYGVETSCHIAELVDMVHNIRKKQKIITPLQLRGHAADFIAQKKATQFMTGLNFAPKKSLSRMIHASLFTSKPQCTTMTAMSGIVVDAFDMSEVMHKAFGQVGGVVASFLDEPTRKKLLSAYADTPEIASAFTNTSTNRAQKMDAILCALPGCASLQDGYSKCQELGYSRQAIDAYTDRALRNPRNTFTIGMKYIQIELGQRAKHGNAFKHLRSAIMYYVNRDMPEGQAAFVSINPLLFGPYISGASHMFADEIAWHHWILSTMHSTRADSIKLVESVFAKVQHEHPTRGWRSTAQSVLLHLKTVGYGMATRRRTN